MKRDDDLIRKLLIETEAAEEWRVTVFEGLNNPPEEEQRNYHIKLLCDAGLMTWETGIMYRMTNQGHDYLDAVRSDNIWQKTKDGAAQVGGMTLGMMKELAIAYLKKEAKDRLGVDL
ncbi:hypothetical protein GCM10011363_04530 [Marivita lacus]|uniref:DUF2513 domain-containing protein n=1 Tax=Marivita lacus TaxID=1323742 RepID=A0ABQ1KDQ4_9RHOB|nr:DUF2513 domain-containing protein [Marivita lacus]GGB91045.1 hypothetical protein GCM10011363_04530 [Marivita lacus]